MQQVDKRKHRTRKHGRLAGLILCAVLLAGCVTAAVLLRNAQDGEPIQKRQRVTGAVTRRKPEELAGLTITRRGEEPWTVIREENGTLRLENEGTQDTDLWIVDNAVGSMLQDAAVNLTYEDVFTENRADWEPDAADFGLADPLVTAEIRFTDGSVVTARIGDSADPDGHAYYYLAVDGDDRLYAVAAGTVQDLNVERALLHPVHKLQISGVLLDRITVKEGDGEVRTEWTRQGKIEDRDAAENWQVTVPFVYPADYESVRNLRETAEDLRLGTYVCEADAQSLEKYGMDMPSAVIELHMDAGSTGTVGMTGIYDVADWEERTVTLTLGGSKSEMTDYVLFNNEIFTINHFTVSVFTDTDPLSTAARYPAAIPLNSLESVLVEKEGQESVYYSLVRIDTGTEKGSAADNPEGSGTVRCLRNGEEIPYETFEAAYERLLTVTVSGRLPADYSNSTPVHTKYTFRTVSGGTHTAALSDYDGMHDALTMDGHTLFYLIKGGMTELP